MTNDDLKAILQRIQEPRFANHVDMLSAALASTDAKVGESARSIRSDELLNIYRTRRDGARAQARSTAALDALVELFGSEPAETWRIFPVSGQDIDGGVFLSDSGRAGCFARTTRDP